MKQSRLVLIAIFLLLPLITEANMLPHPRPKGLAGCGCYWEVNFDLDKKSARFYHDMFLRFRPLNLRISPASTGLDLVRSEQDKCQRQNSTPEQREAVSRMETALVKLLNEADQLEGVSIKCGDESSSNPEKALLCMCPVPGVKVGN